ncbi:1-deoxy-D-xylulose-5-phosphate reductoisomerase [Candidatus Woesearchaeota archaeon]|nr:1-deoxy-D-xylulose-5-phosphate reductoisomerase [Candidatus Woesearchaeota archaeon]
MKKLAILGSTGSIGTQTLEVVDKYPGKLEVVALSSNNNLELLLRQIKKYKPLAVGVADSEKADELRKQVDIDVYSGENAVVRMARLPQYNVLVNALVGLSGIEATLEAIECGKDIALANKETLVAAGEIVMRKVREKGTHLMPIDSEHSALLQCLDGENIGNVHRLILTCSGGALYDKTRDEMQYVSVDDALGHKTWNMGRKITIDSATLMNNGFEVIEAMWLYGIPFSKIKVVIHPQSIIHSMVEYSDGSVIAQMSEPDMRLPIQYALSYPERWGAPIRRLDFTQDLTFAEPDLERFPCLDYAYAAAALKGTLPAEMNAANDYMVSKFLAGECKFMDIPHIIKKVMDANGPRPNPSLKDIKDAIENATKLAERFLMVSPYEKR